MVAKCHALKASVVCAGLRLPTKKLRQIDMEFTIENRIPAQMRGVLTLSKCLESSY